MNVFCICVLEKKLRLLKCDKEFLVSLLQTLRCCKECFLDVASGFDNEFWYANKAVADGVRGNLYRLVIPQFLLECIAKGVVDSTELENNAVLLRFEEGDFHRTPKTASGL